MPMEPSYRIFVLCRLQRTGLLELGTSESKTLPIGELDHTEETRAALRLLPPLGSLRGASVCLL